MNFLKSNLPCDLGAPEYAVTGVASIERISAGQVRITKYSRRRDGNYVLFFEVWDAIEWNRTCHMIEQARESILAEPPSSGPDDHPSRQAH